MWVFYIITELEINKYIIYKRIYGAYILYRSICPLVLYSYTKQDEVVNPLTSKKYNVFNRNYVFDMHDVFQEHNPGVKWDLSVFKAFTHPRKEQKYNCEAKGIFGLELERGTFWTVWEYSQYFMFLTSAWKFQKISIWHNCLITCLHSIILSYINMMRQEHTLSYPLYLYYSNIKYLYTVMMDVTQNTKKTTTYMEVQ
jgi:hypothetical protein